MNSHVLSHRDMIEDNKCLVTVYTTQQSLDNWQKIGNTPAVECLKWFVCCNADGGETLRGNLTDETDYFLLPTEAWTRLVKWYSLVRGQVLLFYSHCSTH